MCAQSCQTWLGANQPRLTQPTEVFIFNKHLGCYIYLLLVTGKMIRSLFLIVFSLILGSLCSYGSSFPWRVSYMWLDSLATYEASPFSLCGWEKTIINVVFTLTAQPCVNVGIQVGLCPLPLPNLSRWKLVHLRWSDSICVLDVFVAWLVFFLELHNTSETLTTHAHSSLGIHARKPYL
jgi:hypothetical protein